MSIKIFLRLGIMFVTVSNMRASEPILVASDNSHAVPVTDCLQPPVLVQGEPLECKTLLARMAEL